MSQLQRFPFHELKIEKSFIRVLAVAPEVTIIAITHSLRLQIMAKGVENTGQMIYLLENGIGRLQGFFFAHPLPHRGIY